MCLWQKKYTWAKNLHLTINVSTIQLLRADFPQEVKSIFEETKLNPNLVALEITETAFITDKEQASRQIDKLKSLGLQIYLDDFGTGYSSLNLINLFEIDALKIDRQFINSYEDIKQAELIKTIIALGKSVGINTIAEGIETKTQLDFLLDAGCPHGQGYYYYKPLNLKQVDQLLADQN